MSTGLVERNGKRWDIMEKVLAEGNLEQLTSQERVSYYQAVCESVGLNAMTQPFQYIRLNNKLTLYAKRECAEQLRHIHGVSITGIEKEVKEGVYIVTAKARTKDNKEDVSTGAVNIKGLAGDNLANAMMKAETKAKRRVTLSVCGLGYLDETEVETIPGAKPIPMDELKPSRKQLLDAVRQALKEATPNKELRKQIVHDALGCDSWEAVERMEDAELAKAPQHIADAAKRILTEREPGEDEPEPEHDMEAVGIESHQ